ncbi:MAG TPA: 30S ribosomal protein S3 [Dehalococcoidia bacterium]|nr:30S ribosomal protein S3 [Chloroflexota bacterium]HCV27501.1 30S ribosomal protein S3 [Dehalococcoidia bacterium]HJM53145.1 30S ribosomal protein S3 [Dehalococcoidia bacterium]
MGQKTHPIGFRLGGVRQWQARWFADKATGYRNLAVEDQAIRKLIADRYEEAGGITRVEIERGTQDLVVSVHTARPGIVIGRGGQRVDELRTELEQLTGKRARLNIQEVRNADVDAFLVARNIADQLERRVAYRRAMRLSAQRTMQAGAQGIKIIASGRLGGAEIARADKAIEGRVPLHTLRADIDFAIAEAATTFGRIGIKVWIYKGDILPEGRAGRTLNVADVVAEQAAASATAAESASVETESEEEAMAGSVTVEIPVEVAAAATETAVEETPEAETESGASDEKSEA